MVTEPLPGALQVYQREWPPALPAWLGSPDSLVALALEPVTAPEAPLKVCAFTKRSFGGADEAAPRLQASEMPPLAPTYPSTATRSEEHTSELQSLTNIVL